jgi:hypothetical protein
MSIDSASFTEDFATLLTFFGVLIIAVFSGYFGPNPFSTETTVESFVNATSNNYPQFTFSIVNISRLSRSLIISLIMERKINVRPSAGDVSLKVEVLYSGTELQIFHHGVNLNQAEFIKDGELS